jgi:hypothetical protein
MATIELIVHGIGRTGEEYSVLNVTSVSWSGDLKQFIITSDVSEFSAQIAVVQLVDDARVASIRCIDDAGAEYLSFQCTDARVRGYSIGAGGGVYGAETFSLVCTSVEMTSGEYVAIVS